MRQHFLQKKISNTFAFASEKRTFIYTKIDNLTIDFLIHLIVNYLVKKSSFEGSL